MIKFQIFQDVDPATQKIVLVWLLIFIPLIYFVPKITVNFGEMKSNHNREEWKKGDYVWWQKWVSLKKISSFRELVKE